MQHSQRVGVLSLEWKFYLSNLLDVRGVSNEGLFFNLFRVVNGQNIASFLHKQLTKGRKLRINDSSEVFLGVINSTEVIF